MSPATRPEPGVLAVAGDEDAQRSMAGPPDAGQEMCAVRAVPAITRRVLLPLDTPT